MIFAGIGGQIVQDVAAARGDGDQPVMGLELQRLQIDVGVFPDLVVDKPLNIRVKRRSARRAW